MKISDYTRQLRPDPLSYVVLEYKGSNYRTQLINLLAVVRLNRTFVGSLRDDFLVEGSASHIPPGFYVEGVSVVDPSLISSEPNHPGITRIVSGAGSGSGARIGIPAGSVSLRIYGGDVFEIIWRQLSVSGIGVRFGFMDTSAISTPPTNSVFVNILNDTLSATTYHGGSQSTTPTSYVLSSTVWYRALIQVSEDRSLVTFSLYSDDGALLWRDTLDSNIPDPQDLNGQSPTAMFLSTSPGIQNLADVDYMAYSSSKVLVR